MERMIEGDRVRGKIDIGGDEEREREREREREGEGNTG